MIFPSAADQLAAAHEEYGFFAPRAGSNFAIAAVVNCFRESSFQPKALGDHGTAFGLWQEHPVRVAAIKAATEIDLSAFPSVADQCRAIWYEMQTSEKHAYAMIKAAKTAADATEAWCRYFERPADHDEPARRASLAAQWMQKLGVVETE